MDTISALYDWLAAAPLFIQVAAGIGVAYVALWVVIAVIGAVSSVLDWAYRP